MPNRHLDRVDEEDSWFLRLQLMPMVVDGDWKEARLIPVTTMSIVSGREHTLTYWHPEKHDLGSTSLQRSHASDTKPSQSEAAAVHKFSAIAAFLVWHDLLNTL